MKKIILALPLVVLLASALALPYIASAAVNQDVWNPSILKGPLVTCAGGPVDMTTGTAQDNPNACHSLCDLVATMANVIYFFIGVVIWIITPIMVVWAGILFMLSGGSPEKIGNARKMLTGIVIGILIVLCAYLIVYTFVNVLQIGNWIGGFGTSVCTIT